MEHYSPSLDNLSFQGICLKSDPLLSPARLRLH